jgi:hypothetical protein
MTMDEAKEQSIGRGTRCSAIAAGNVAIRGLAIEGRAGLRLGGTSDPDSKGR